MTANPNFKQPLLAESTHFSMNVPPHICILLFSCFMTRNPNYGAQGGDQLWEGKGDKYEKEIGH